MALIIYIPFESNSSNEPVDRDGWFIDSFAEIIEDIVENKLKGKIARYIASGIEIGILVSEPASKIVIDSLWDTLRRHCPRGTYIDVMDEAAPNPYEKIPLFKESEIPPEEPLPVNDPQFEYKPFSVSPLENKCSASNRMKRIFKSIAIANGINVEMIYLTECQNGGKLFFSEKKNRRFLDILEKVDYIQREGDFYFVTESMQALLPRTASGRVSLLRDDAWEALYKAIFK